jgi:acyl-CoA reductase-like NAD-dependent aldehyde dehydrogenase
MTDALLAPTSPLDGKPLAPEVRAAPVDTIPALAKAAAEAQRAWAARPMAERIDAVAKVKRRILERAAEIGELVHREVGKPVEEALLAEVLPNADLVDYWCDSIEELCESRPVALDALSYPGKDGRIHQEPRGVVALVTPWNYPVAIPLRTLVPALLAGNAVLFKPSEHSPRAGALVASLFEGVLPPAVLTLVQGGAEVGRALVEAPEVALVVFTGSVATGRAIAHACAERLIPSSLELGGKDAAIVLADCKLERAAQGVVWAAFTNAGQNCAGVERVYVERKIADAFSDRVVAVTKSLVRGRDTAVLTTAAQRDKVRAHLEEAVAAGGELLVGGAPEDPGSLAFPPTVVRLDARKHAGCRLLREETFGPILPIVAVDDADDAVALANESDYALTTSVWTARVERGAALARALRSGVVTVNNHAFTAALPAAPWTGAGATGYGVTNSPHALHALTRPRFVLEDRNRAARELWWYPYTPVLRTIALAMAALRGGAGLVGRLVALFRLLGALPKRLLGG